jgi:hypothetical protein
MIHTRFACSFCRTFMLAHNSVLAFAAAWLAACFFFISCCAWATWISRNAILVVAATMPTVSTTGNPGLPRSMQNRTGRTLAIHDGAYRIPRMITYSEPSTALVPALVSRTQLASYGALAREQPPHLSPQLRLAGSPRPGFRSSRLALSVASRSDLQYNIVNRWWAVGIDGRDSPDLSCTAMAKELVYLYHLSKPSLTRSDSAVHVAVDFSRLPSFLVNMNLLTVVRGCSKTRRMPST